MSCDVTTRFVDVSGTNSFSLGPHDLKRVDRDEKDTFLDDILGEIKGGNTV